MSSDCDPVRLKRLFDQQPASNGRGHIAMYAWRSAAPRQPRSVAFAYAAGMGACTALLAVTGRRSSTPLSTAIHSRRMTKETRS